MDRQRETVRRSRERILDRYDGVETVRTEEVVADDRFPELRELSGAGYAGGAYALVRRSPAQAPPLSASMGDVDEAGKRLLLVLHRGATAWDVPGGGRDPGERFEDAAVREVREETGVECSITDCRFLEHRVTVADGHPEQLHTLWAYFEARYREGTIAVQASELNGAAWFRSLPERTREGVERSTGE